MNGVDEENIEPLPTQKGIQDSDWEEKYPSFNKFRRVEGRPAPETNLKDVLGLFVDGWNHMIDEFAQRKAEGPLIFDEATKKQINSDTAIAKEFMHGVYQTILHPFSGPPSPEQFREEDLEVTILNDIKNEEYARRGRETISNVSKYCQNMFTTGCQKIGAAARVFAAPALSAGLLAGTTAAVLFNPEWITPNYIAASDSLLNTGIDNVLTPSYFAHVDSVTNSINDSLQVVNEQVNATQLDKMNIADVNSITNTQVNTVTEIRQSYGNTLLEGEISSHSSFDLSYDAINNEQLTTHTETTHTLTETSRYQNLFEIKDVYQELSTGVTPSESPQHTFDYQKQFNFSTYEWV